MKCKKSCEGLIVKDTRLLKVLDAFKKEFGVTKNHKDILRDFYEYISKKYDIQCEIGMIIVERHILQNVYKR